MSYICKLCEDGETFETEDEAKQHCEDEHADRVDVNLESYMSDAIDDTFDQIIEADEEADE